MSEASAWQQLLTRALSALGVATVGDIADYLRLRARDIAPRLETSGAVSAQVVGWKDPAWIPTEVADTWRHAELKPWTGFLSPFDSLIWYRPRVQRLFNFHQVLEAYKPAGQRTFGYFVCPLLQDGALVGRADLKYDAHLGRIAALTWHPEQGLSVSPAAVDRALDYLSAAAMTD